MTVAALDPTALVRPADGGRPARRAMTRWAWRLFRREWRQQLLILALVVVAVAATILGSAVATNSPAPANAGFGTAQDRAVLSGSDPHLHAELATLAHDAPLQLIENETLPVPGSVDTFQIRSQDPHGPFGTPMLTLASGRYPAAPDEVAVTPSVASDFHLRVGGSWHELGRTWHVVGTVQDPQSLLDAFALVLPGQVAKPTQVIVLFDANGAQPVRHRRGRPTSGSLPAYVQSAASMSSSNAFNPETISIAGLTIGMLLIALVGIGGFTVLAQRRLRSLGMLESLGATDRHVSLVVRANGAIVGAVGALAGLVLGLLLWLAYRPALEQSSHHLIGMFALPWVVVGIAVALAVVATYLAACRPARAVAAIPVMAALSGRPPAPRQIHRSAIPGLVVLALAFVVLGFSGSGGSRQNGSQMMELVVGLILLIPGIILLSPFCLSVLARLGRPAPVAARLALRDLARYRARSGAALGAISLGILIAVIVSLVAAARYANVLDYAGPNLASNQVIAYTPNGPYGPSGPGTGSGNAVRPGELASERAAVRQIASMLGARRTVELEETSALLQHAASGRNFSGPVYVATPQLLAAFGVKASTIDPKAAILTMRPGLSSISRMQLVYGNYFGPGPGPSRGSPNSYPCPRGGCLANPVIQQVDALPAGTSAPNTVITEHAVRELHLQPIVSGWLVEAPKAIGAAQISNAEVLAATSNLSLETKNSQPTSSEISGYATAFGAILALAILAMTVGLIRSETGGDLRTLAATGASSFARRTITATTAGALALAGAVLGTGAGYLAVIGYMRSNSFDGGIGALGAVPVLDLLGVLVFMPLVAGLMGWLLGGREPAVIARQPIG